MSPAGESFWPLEKILDQRKLAQSLAANLDIMIRTLLLVFSFAFFTNQGARFGDIALAANHILLQIISFSAFFLDGFAFAVEGLVVGLSALAIHCSLRLQSGAPVCWLQSRRLFWLRLSCYSARI